MLPEVGPVAGGGSDPARGPTKSNTPNPLAFTKTSSIWMLGEDSKSLDLCSSEEFHTLEAAAPFFSNPGRQVKNARDLAVCSWTVIF